MRHPRRATSSLSREDALAQQKIMAGVLKAMGLTQPPNRMCAGVKKYGQGWAVYVGYQDSDDLGVRMRDAQTGRVCDGRNGSLRFAGRFPA